MQYTVKHEQGIDCGGAYLKLGGGEFDGKKFNGDSPYNIMFGPDICGMTKRTHLIFNYKDNNLLKEKDAASIKTIVVDCLGRIPQPRLLQLLNDGFAGVVTVSCDEGMCTHKTGNKVAEKRVREVAATLSELQAAGRIRFFEVFQLFKSGLNNVVKEIIDRK